MKWLFLFHTVLWYFILQPNMILAKKAIWRLGPIGLSPRQQQQGFVWQASVDRTTGKAFAKEVSQIPAKTRNGALLFLGSGSSSTNSAGQAILQTKPVLGRYPEWLCRGSVTLGLLRAVPADDNYNKSSGGGGTRIQTRLFGIPLLTFGKPVGQRIALKAAGIRDDAVQWRYPITGGWMTATTSGTQQPAGELILTLKSVSSSKPAALTLETQLVDYRPALVGKHTPANPMRVGFYLATQSIIHGYTMWRFHRHVRNFF